MVARLARQIAGALAILQNQHAIAVEPSNDRTRGRGAEAARRRRRAGSRASRRASSRAAWSAPVRPARTSAETHRTGCATSALTEATSWKCRSGSTRTLDAGTASACRNRHFGAARRISLRAHRQVIAARRDVLEAERSVRTGHGFALQLFDARPSRRRSASPESEFTSRPSKAAVCWANAWADAARTSMNERKHFI